jgi:hypothetical protein
MARVTSAEVLQATGETAGDPNLFIQIASHIVTEELGGLDPAHSEYTLKCIELYLAAHYFFLARREGPLAAQSVDEASERYHDIYGPGLHATRFGQQALSFDSSGRLAEWAARASEKVKLPALFTVV